MSENGGTRLSLSQALIILLFSGLCDCMIRGKRDREWMRGEGESFVLLKTLHFMNLGPHS